MTKESCASRIKKALRLRGIKQSELCTMTGIPKSAMSQYVNGAFEPKQDRLSNIAAALDVSEAWLMGYDVPMKNQISTLCQNRSSAERDEEYQTLKSLLADIKSGKSSPAGALIGFGGHGQEILDITDEDYIVIKAMIEARKKARENKDKK